jgi:putative nucleotidyltransferase with HDIG domain
MLKHQSMEFEFVGARKESYRLDSRKPVVQTGTLEDDQLRRDFTINSLAVSLNSKDFGTIIDPFNGLKHLEEKIIKTPTEPGKTFSDDPLRIMRGIRFATELGFTIEAETFKAMSAYRNRLNIVSQERITAEIEKILESERPSSGFKMLFNCQVLPIVFPELAAMQGVEVKEGVGHKDNFYHTLEVVDNLALNSKNIWLRWAALLHDIAKPATKRFNPKDGWTFHGHENLGAAMIPRIFRKMRLPQDKCMKYVQKLVQLHLRPISLTSEEITDSAVRRLLFEAGDDIDDLMLLAQADITSKNDAKVKRYLANYEVLKERIIEVEEADHLRNWQPPVSGIDIMNTFGIGPSKEVGIIKNAIREAILDGEISNNFGDAYRFMLKKGKEYGFDPLKILTESTADKKEQA